MYQTVLFFHLAGAIVWVGGMFFAHFCLRPAAMQVLEPPQRLPLWAATLRRFLRFVAVAVAVLVASGFHLLFRAGLAGAPHGWLAMTVLGLVMTGVFVYVYAGLYPRLARNAQAANWPAAAAALNGIRRLVTVNLILSVAVVAAAVSAR
jgi:uncharacterized membrane protein